MRTLAAVPLTVLATLLVVTSFACQEFNLTREEPDPEAPIYGPEALIESPVTGEVIAMGYSAPLLEGTVSDPDEPESALLASWSSDVDGHLADPEPSEFGDVSIGETALSVGRHTLTLTAIDGDGQQGTDEVEIEVCEITDDGHMRVENSGNIWVRLLFTEADATNELYVIEPVLLTITEDAQQDWGLKINLGPFDACTAIAFRMVTSLNGNSYDSTTSPNFEITRMERNQWEIGVEDGGDFDYNDIVFEVVGGLGDEPPEWWVDLPGQN